MNDMRAVRLHATSAGQTPATIEIDDVDRPVTKSGEVLLQVHACGLCGLDRQLIDGSLGNSRLPLTLGHEAAGVIAEVGPGVADWQPGDRVAALTVRGCLICPYCRGGRENLCRDSDQPGITSDGAMAEYVAVASEALVPIPAAVTFGQAAIATDAVATPYHALKRAGVGPELSLAVHGLGNHGMHAVILAKLAGAHVIGVDIDEARLDLALELGADDVIDARQPNPGEAVRALTGGGVDRSLEIVGSPDAMREAMASLRPGGRAVIVGLGTDTLDRLDASRLVANELELVGSYGSTAQDVGELFDLLDDGRLHLVLPQLPDVPLSEASDAIIQFAADTRRQPTFVVAPQA